MGGLIVKSFELFVSKQEMLLLFMPFVDSCNLIDYKTVASTEAIVGNLVQFKAFRRI